ncbi:hypothetical protein GR173_004686 [Salmonella enterica subsp. enterica]|nr:hypothetical protein [Salmonella enterica subsp. enterica serovar Nigeria]EDU0171499.1 hypothetical protein [Salmonella enterica subsp. enterica serovar Belfast]EDW4633112.1 hypothetical protein [Salmonella enterica subsp. enterica]EEF0877427.1 hypothetical protein [Salmonella enterica subsp. enterica serovar Tafo]EGI5715108.1 hypothetical protein [Salmonella enterica subsp. enterica serovar Durham]EIH3027308.1 hypothetical protein [Salmonella enterica subsp. enterica serovar Telelkebir]
MKTIDHFNFLNFHHVNISFSDIDNMHLIAIEHVTPERNVVDSYAGRIRKETKARIISALRKDINETVGCDYCVSLNYWETLYPVLPVSRDDLVVEGGICDITERFKVSADTALLFMRLNNDR